MQLGPKAAQNMQVATDRVLETLKFFPEEPERGFLTLRECGGKFPHLSLSFFLSLFSRMP